MLATQPWLQETQERPSLVLEEPVGGLPKNEPGDPEEFFRGFGGGPKLRLYISRVNPVVETE